MRIKTTKSIYAIYFMVLSIIFLGFEFLRLGDFYIYLEAASDLFSTSNIYKNLYGKPPVLFYFGNPFITTIFYPLTLIPFHFSAILWKLLNLLLLFRIFQFINETLFKKNENEILKFTATLLLLIGSFFWVYSNFHLVQLTIVILYLSIEGLNFIFYKNNSITGGILLGLSMCIKLTPIVFIPYLIYNRKWKATLSTISIIFCAILLPSFITGWHGNIVQWTDWLNSLFPEDVNWAIFDMNNRKNHGISAWLSTLLIADITDNKISLTHRRHLLNLEPETVKYIIYSMRLVLVFLTLYFLRTLNSTKTNLKRYWEWSYLFLIIPLFFPQQRLYNFLFLIPALSYIIYFQVAEYKKEKKITWESVLLAIILVVFNLELILGVFRKYFWYHKSMTYATLLLLILLILTLPKITKEKQLTP